MRSRRGGTWSGVAVVLLGAACSARGINGEASDDRAAGELRAAAGVSLGASFRFRGTEAKGGTDLPDVNGTFSPTSRVRLDRPAPGALPAVADPALLLSDIEGTRYVTRSSGSLRFNLVATDLDALVGGGAADDDDFAGEAFVSRGKVARVRFQATRAGVHYLGDVAISPA
ncbi:MAG TPA: hypothetical protein VF954_05030 [Acidimicrobiales bacterium]